MHKNEHGLSQRSEAIGGDVEHRARRTAPLNLDTMSRSPATLPSGGGEGDGDIVIVDDFFRRPC
jgi:hypothetical protein